MAAAAIAAAITLIFISFPPTFSQSEIPDFVYNGFNGFNGFNDTELTTVGATIIKPSGTLRLTNTSLRVTGHAFYPNQIHMFDGNSSKVSSFSTSFVFLITSPTAGNGGYGLAFAITPTTHLPGAGAEHYLGLFNESNVGNSSNHIFAVEFDTVNGFGEKSNTKGNHVGINNNSVKSIDLEPGAYHDPVKDELEMEGKPIRAWIDYDGNTTLLNVTIAPYAIDKKPITPLISLPFDLSSTLKENMYIGFSASTGEKASNHYILGWSFKMNGIARELNISQLSVPHIENSKSTKLNIKILIGLLSVGVFVLLGLLGFFVYRRVNHFEELEDWELDSPHRFRYKELFRAAKGFRKSEIIGAGGFGVVYKGVLPATGVEVAVKKIGRNSIQGMREFAAEIESLGRLRHKHLVNLQGWCKRKNDLLLVYEYVPNGSLDSLLFKVKDNFVLSWEQRFSILKGVAAGLLYLHEEWEKVVIHRDVKSSNVLIDADMNARLGDFGLARLYDHGKVSHTTNVVGTIGYIAPELTRTGKASASSDVFAYGVLLVEVVCGRKPIDSDQLVMMDWVMECHEMGRILDCVDSRLNSNYIAEEVELVLKLGLICTFHKPEMRPTMRKIIRILHGDDPLPVLQKWTSVDSQTFDGTEFRSFEIISSDTIISSHPSSSFGGISSSSLQAGR